MVKILGGLKGKKTYILVGIGVLTQIVYLGYSDINLIEFITSPDVLKLLELLGIGTLRAGVAKIGK